MPHAPSEAKPNHEHLIHVTVNRRRIETADATVTGQKLLELAGFEGNEWDLLQLHGEGDPSGGALISAEQPLQLHNGDRFRVVPGNRTFGGGEG